MRARFEWKIRISCADLAEHKPLKLDRLRLASFSVAASNAVDGAMLRAIEDHEAGERERARLEERRAEIRGKIQALFAGPEMRLDRDEKLSAAEVAQLLARFEELWAEERNLDKMEKFMFSLEKERQWPSR